MKPRHILYAASAGLGIALAMVTRRTLRPLPAIPFVSALHYGSAERTGVDLVVLHTSQQSESPGGAQRLAQMFATDPDNRHVSAHYSVDDREIVQSVREPHIAYGAKSPANELGVHIELVGRAEQTPAQWRDPYSQSQSDLAALLVAHITRRWGIPPRFVNAIGLLSGHRGITTHAEVTKAWHRTDHTDPGPNFPIQDFVFRVQKELS